MVKSERFKNVAIGYKFCLISLFALSCNQGSKTINKVDKINVDSIKTVIREKEFNIELIPDATEVWPTRHGGIIGAIENKKYVAMKSSIGALLIGGDSPFYQLRPSNFPDLISHGDTVIVSGSIYGIRNNEFMIGVPFLIRKMYIKTNYIRYRVGSK